MIATPMASQSSPLTSSLMGPVASAEPAVYPVTLPADSPSAPSHRQRTTGGWLTSWQAITPFEALGVRRFRLPFPSSVSSNEFAEDYDEVKPAWRHPPHRAAIGRSDLGRVYNESSPTCCSADASQVAHPHQHRFQRTPLSVGTQETTERTWLMMRSLLRSSFITAVLAFTWAAALRADSVTDWSLIAEDSIVDVQGKPPSPSTINMAMVHIAFSSGSFPISNSPASIDGAFTDRNQSSAQQEERT